jgi:hypothetical protein
METITALPIITEATDLLINLRAQLPIIETTLPVLLVAAMATVALHRVVPAVAVLVAAVPAPVLWVVADSPVVGEEEVSPVAVDAVNG